MHHKLYLLSLSRNANLKVFLWCDDQKSLKETLHYYACLFAFFMCMNQLTYAISI